MNHWVDQIRKGVKAIRSTTLVTGLFQRLPSGSFEELDIQDKMSTTKPAENPMEPAPISPPDEQALPAPELFNNWQTTLAASAGTLLELSRSTESEFLTLGDRLNRINTSNRENTGLNQLVSNTLVTDKSSDIKLLQELLDTCFKMAGKAESSLESLSSEMKRMVDNIGEIVHLNNLLDRTYRALRMVRVMIRVETENAGYRVFNTVSNALIEMEDQISRNAEQIHSRSSLTIDLILDILSRFENDAGSDQTFTKNDQSQIGELIAVIQAEIADIEKACGRMEDFTQSISRGINSVVVNLQFHDNYRQRLEHVSQTITEVGQKLTTAVAKKQFLSSHIKPWATTVIQLQIAQLENLKQKNRDVSEQLTSSFSDIASLLQEQMKTATQMLPTMTSLDQHAAELNRLIQQFSQYMGSYKATSTRILDSTDELAQHVSGITELSSLIETNELNLRLLALNSMIKASSIGRRGKPLAVLSKEINTISQSVQEQISERGSVITAIHTGADTITTQYLEQFKTSVSETDEIFSRTGASIERLLKKDDQATHSSDVARKLQSDFSDMIEQFQFSRNIETGLNSTIKQLQEIYQSLDSQLPDPPPDSDPGEFDLKDVTRKYTMQLEREIHNTAVFSDSEPRKTNEVASDTIELFEDIVQSSPPKSQDESPEADLNLGDNVELF